jgi:hypothetical protein
MRAPAVTVFEGFWPVVGGLTTGVRPFDITPSYI